MKNTSNHCRRLRASAALFVTPTVLPQYVLSAQPKMSITLSDADAKAVAVEMERSVVRAVKVQL